MKIYSLYVWIDGSQSIVKTCFNIANTATTDLLVHKIEQEEDIVLGDKEKEQLAEVINGAEVSSFYHDDDFIGAYGTNFQLMKQRFLETLTQLDLSDQRVISNLYALTV